MRKILLGMAFAAGLLAAAGQASAGFVNGNFETGTAAGWTQGGGYRAGINNASLNPATFIPGDGGVRSGIVTPGDDPRVGNLLNRVYGGTGYSFRAENTSNGGYASVITQTVANWTDANIFFAWAAVLQGAHGEDDAATFKLVLRDDTAGTDLVTRQYNAASSGGGVDARFHSANGFFYTDWQVENIDTSGASGHTLTLSLLAADCQPTGHAGYVYLDGFGAVTPPPGGGGVVPEPGTLILLGSGLIGLAGVSRRRAKK